MLLGVSCLELVGSPQNNYQNKLYCRPVADSPITSCFLFRFYEFFCGNSCTIMHIVSSCNHVCVSNVSYDYMYFRCSLAHDYSVSKHIYSLSVCVCGCITFLSYNHIQNELGIPGDYVGQVHDDWWRGRQAIPVVRQQAGATGSVRTDGHVDVYHRAYERQLLPAGKLPTCTWSPSTRPIILSVIHSTEKVLNRNSISWRYLYIIRCTNVVTFFIKIRVLLCTFNVHLHISRRRHS